MLVIIHGVNGLYRVLGGIESFMKEEQLIELLNDMSVEEKIGQLLQLTGNFFDGDGLATGPMQDMNLTPEQVINTGSVLSTVGAAKIRAIQTEYMKHQPHHIPMIFMADVINGFRTVFPIPLAQGCSFNPELVEELAGMAAKESARDGLHVTFSPMVDLVRDARWGRVMESTGEDVYLNGLMAKAMVCGYQGDGIGSKDKISACVKHFAGYGAPMGGRDYNTVEMSERSFKEEYMPGYKACIDADARMFMTSFNTLGRVPSSANKELCRDTLRDEWGFDGILISDWAAIKEIVFHGLTDSDEEAAYLGLRAGVDIDMMTNVYTNNLKNAIENGKVPMEWLDESVLRILKFKNELGLFENPFKDADEAYDELSEIPKENRALARKACAETFVLLKNEDNILPLSKEDTSKSIAFVGPYMEETKVCGSWSLFYKGEECITIARALEELKLKVPYTVSRGCNTLGYGKSSDGFTGHIVNDISLEDLKKLEAEAIENAKKADTVVMFLGEYFNETGEAGSKTEITIPEHQLELFRKITQVNSNVVVVNFSGRPLDMREIDRKAKAILQVWFPGTETGHAVMDVLFGDANPSGRLSMSFPYNVGQVPVFYSELHTGRRYEEGSENRFCSRYLDAPNKPLYIFGYGLDYTEYEYSNLSLDKDILTLDDTITVTVDVKNVGARDGIEVVQMYIQDMVGSVARPVRELKGFEKISLKAGEKKKVTFKISADMLKFYDINMDYVAEKGDFKVFVGRDSDAEMEASFKLI